jgi:outer membrane lipoprotein-sorting protein
MKHVTKLACGLLAAALVPAVRAQDNEGEKLFRAMEKKIQTARAFRVAFTIKGQGDTKERTADFRGTLLLTNDNKARLKVRGEDFGEARRWEMVSDGKQVFLMPYTVSGVEGDKEEETLPTPRNLHGYLAMRVSRLGVYLNLPRLAAVVLAADGPDEKLDVGDFQVVVAEKVGGRDAKVVRCKMKLKGKLLDDVVSSVWIDTKTLLPLKRLIVTKSWGTITEHYNDFTLDPKIGPREFRLPKPAVLPEENVPPEKLPKAVREAVRKRFPGKVLGDGVLARPGSEWLRPDQKGPLYLLNLSNGHLHIALWVTPAGEITEIVNEIKATDLPKAARQTLDKDFPGWEKGLEVDQIIKVKEGKEKLVHIKVFLSPPGKTTRVLLFSPEGKFLKDATEAGHGADKKTIDR